MTSESRSAFPESPLRGLFWAVAVCTLAAWGFQIAAVALGALAIAVSANIHAMNAAGGLRRNMAAAMVIWPIAGGLMGFVAAWVVAAGLARLRLSDRL